MSGLSKADYAAIKTVASEVYGLPYSLEFREPVYISYPELMETYLDSISNPMDLGTVLLKLNRCEYSSSEECAGDISLVFDNAIKFNPDLIHLVSNAKALRDFASALWMEVVNSPFEGSYTSEEFHKQRMAKRRDRMSFTRHLPLSTAECTLFGNKLMAYQKSGALLEERMEAILEACARSSPDSPVTLANLAAPLFQFFRSEDNSRTGRDMSDGSSLPCFVTALSPSDSHRSQLARSLTPPPLPPRMAFVDYLDSVFGQVSVHLTEKACRGYFVSSIWARPYSLVWAQPNKSPWWPAAVLAGADVPPAICEANLSRVPPSIKQALVKLKPKSKDKEKDKDKDTNFIPPGLYLAEYFGTHDFGWIRMEKTIPYPENGTLLVPPDLKSSGGADKCTHDAVALEEAQEAYPLVMCKESVVELAPPEELDLEAILVQLAAKVDAIGPVVESYQETKRENLKKDKDATKTQPRKGSSKKKEKEVVPAMVVQEEVGGEGGVARAYNCSFTDNLRNVDMSQLSKKELAGRKARILSVKLRQLEKAEGAPQHWEVPGHAEVAPLFGTRGGFEGGRGCDVL